MRIKLSTFLLHFFIWLVLLAIPAASAIHLIQSFAPDNFETQLWPFLINAICVIVVFYLNYLFLAPRFLIAKKYVIYFITLVFLILVCVLCFHLSMGFFGYNGVINMQSNPNLKLIKPIARANIFLTLTLAMIISIVLSLNDHLRAAEKEKVNAQFFSLKAQINPHFLFNTLNSIYANTLEASPKAAEMIAKLSEIMRYSMRQHERNLIDLTEEFDYLQNFIELHKMRLDKNIKVSQEFYGDLKGLKIAPMMLVPFVENAFKHGVNPEEKSHIQIHFLVQQNQLSLRVNNTKVEQQKDITELSGLGISNTKKRLSYTYPNKHQLTIEDLETEFKVELNIDLS